MCSLSSLLFFFFNDTATTEIYTLSLHDALPIFADAIAAFTRALELDPKMQVAQRNLEIAYHDTGYYDRRVAQLQERLRQAPDDRDARWELGRAYAILGAHEEAGGEFGQLLAHSPNDV